MKKILATFAMLASLQADMIMDVISEQTVLPGLKILAAGQLDERFDKIFRSDMFVGAKFDLDATEPEYTLTYELANSGKNAALKLTLQDKSGAKKFEQNFDAPSAQLPFLSHAAVAAMHKELALANLDWMNKKLLITRKIAAKQSQIIEADYTLSYQKVLRQGGLNLFAKWANAAQSEYFFSDYNADELAIYRAQSGGKRLIAKGRGMLALSDIRGNSALITTTYADQPEIALLDLTTGGIKRLTNYAGIDVSARFYGEGDYAFVSDRGGYPNIFMAPLDGGVTSQLVYHGKNNSSFGVWEDYLVYSSREKSGDFNLYLMNKNSQNIRQLTLNGKNTFPAFSDDGKTILFIKYLGMQSSVGILRLDENRVFFFPMKIGRISTLDW